MMLRLQDQGYHTLAQFGGRAFNYISNFVMQTAIKVSTEVGTFGDGINSQKCILCSDIYVELLTNY